MPGHARAQDDLPCVIHPHRVKHTLCHIDPEDIHLLLHWTRLLWVHGFTALLELIVAYCRRSAQGRVHFITTVLCADHTSIPYQRRAKHAGPCGVEVEG